MERLETQAKEEVEGVTYPILTRKEAEDYIRKLSSKTREELRDGPRNRVEGETPEYFAFRMALQRAASRIE
jgi:hypothetical protein